MEFWFPPVCSAFPGGHPFTVQNGEEIILSSNFQG